MMIVEAFTQVPVTVCIEKMSYAMIKCGQNN
jgi:hypothetical protein